MGTNLKDYGFEGTLGEWEAVPIIHTYRHGIASNGEVFFQSAESVSRKQHDVDHANTKLIAKSPELAMALIDLVKAVRKHDFLSCNVVLEQKAAEKVLTEAGIKIGE